MFDRFVEAGGTFFDTANIYMKGTCEQFLGEFIKGIRERCVIGTKYSLSTDTSNPNASGNGRKNMMESVHTSLRRLNTDYIDLLWVHAWDTYTPIEEIMRGLDDLVHQGKVFYIGASNMPAWVISSLLTLTHERNESPFIVLQLEYSLIERTIEREYFEWRYLILSERNEDTNEPNLICDLYPILSRSYSTI